MAWRKRGSADIDIWDGKLMTQWTPCESGGWRRLWPWLQSVCTITDTSIASAVRPPDALQCYPSCCTSTAAAWFSLSLSFSGAFFFCFCNDCHRCCRCWYFRVVSVVADLILHQPSSVLLAASQSQSVSQSDYCTILQLHLLHHQQHHSHHQQQ